MNTQDRTSNYQADSLSLVGAISLGTGVMIGAGIFALTGQMAEMTGSLFPLAFLSAALIVSTGVGRIRGLVYGDPGHAGHSGRHHRQHFRGVSHAGHADQDEIGAPQSLRNARQHSEAYAGLWRERKSQTWAPILNTETIPIPSARNTLENGVDRVRPVLAHGIALPVPGRTATLERRSNPSSGRTA